VGGFGPQTALMGDLRWGPCR